MPSVLLFTPTIAILLKDLIPYFFVQEINDKEGQEDLTKYIQNLNFAIDSETYTDKDQKFIATRVIFRTHLCNKALLWYHGLSSETRASWQLLKTAFFSQFALVV